MSLDIVDVSGKLLNYKREMQTSAGRRRRILEFENFQRPLVRSFHQPGRLLMPSKKKAHEMYTSGEIHPPTEKLSTGRD